MHTDTILEISHIATQIIILLSITYHFYTVVAVQEWKYNTAIGKYSDLALRLTTCSVLILFLFQLIARMVILT